MKNRYFYMDKEDGSIISIVRPRKPVKRKLGYVVYEYSNKHRKWVMPCFPEIYWGQLSSRFVYIGKAKYEDTPSKKDME